MGRRGPRPTPTGLKIASGTHRADRHGAVKDTQGGVISLPEPPETLGDAGRTAWVRFGTVAESLGLLEPRFLGALERLCDAYDRLAWASEDIGAKGRVQLSETGYECPRPSVAIEKEARDEIRRYLIEFGWTPAAAANVKITRESKPRGVKARPF